MEAMELTVRRAERAEYEAVRAFYYAVIDHMRGSPYNATWARDVYPEDALLRRLVDRGELYVAESRGRIVAAMAVNQSPGEGYDRAAWLVDAPPSHVAVLHLLAVLPEASRQGLGGRMTREAIRIAREAGMRALRLDVLPGNLPAIRAYQTAGFRFVERLSLHYEFLGPRDFDLYEYVL